MTSSTFLVLLLLQFHFGQSSHKHLHDDHYIGQQHNPEHDMNVLLGDEVAFFHIFCTLELYFYPSSSISSLSCPASFTQRTNEIKKLSPADQKIKMMDIVKKIDTNGDNLLSAGIFVLLPVKHRQTKGINNHTQAVCFIHRGDYSLDSACLQKICSGWCGGALPWVWHQ